jgi:hypothetical protein
MRLVAEVESAFGVELPLRSVFESSTLEAFARAVDAAAADTAGPGGRIVPVPRHRQRSPAAEARPRVADPAPGP